MTLPIPVLLTLLSRCFSVSVNEDECGEDVFPLLLLFEMLMPSS